MYIFCPVRGVIARHMLVNGQINIYILWGLVKTAALGFRKTILNFKSQVCHFLIVWPWLV